MKPTPITDTPPPTAPRPVVNPAGADQLAVRVGTHDSFLAAMLGRLTSVDYPRLAELRTRRPDDPAIALLDAWATAADVLTFYTERVANEAFLRTARERRSLIELANLVGYRPGPGVAANTFLAFGLEKGVLQTSVETVIPAGTAVKSVPTGNELPQTFETSEAITARGEWNALRPRMTLPQKIDEKTVGSVSTLFLEGTDSSLKPNDRIVLFPKPDLSSTAFAVREVVIDRPNNRTEVRLVESTFSVPRMFRATSDAITSFLTAADASEVAWLKTDAADDVKKFLEKDTGPQPRPALKDWKKLSLFDQFLFPWRPPAETVAGLAAATTALNDATSQYRQFPLKVKTATDGEKPLVAKALHVADELLAWDKAATGAFVAVDPLDGTDQDKVRAARDAIDTLIKEVPVGHVLTEHDKKVTDLFNTVEAWVTTPATPRPATVTTALSNLKGWWGLKTDGDLNTDADKINRHSTALQKELVKEEPPSSFKKKFEAIETATDKLTTLMTGLPDTSPKKARVKEVVDLLTTYRKELDDAFVAIVDTTAPIASDTSKILSELSAYLNTKIVKPIKDATTLPMKLERAKSLQPKAAAAVAGAGALVAMVTTFRTKVTDLRKEFDKKADEIVTRYADLEAAGTPPVPIPVKDAWLNEIKPTLSTVETTGLDKTIAAIGDDSSGHITKLLQLVDLGGSTFGPRVRGLLRDLRAFAGLNGGGGLAAPPEDPPSTAGGGLGTATKGGPLPRADGFILVRAADEILLIPEGADAIKDTARDVVVQLTTAFGLAPPEELRAKWSAVRFGKQEATAALLSQPLSLFGHNAPRQVFEKDTFKVKPLAATEDWPAATGEYTGRVHLASELSGLVGPTDLFLQLPDKPEEQYRVSTPPRIVSRSDYGLTQKTTRCDLDGSPVWPVGNTDAHIGTLRIALASVPIKTLPLAEQPITAVIGIDAVITHDQFAAETDQIELDGIHLGLRPGHLVVVEGERDKLPGVIGRELRRIKLAQHTLRDLPGDRVHTRIFLDAPLQFTYVRETVKVHANVVPATHGETVREVLGSGAAARSFQRFPLRRAPLTYLPAPTPSGVRSTLAVRANDLLWHEQDTLLDSGPAARDYSTATDDGGRTALTFGDGRTGGRLPTGRENVRAEYRVGLGKVGNVRGGAITQLAHRPLGVKDVTNPLAATGGADPDTPEQIRANAPIGVLALDRLVSVDDYASFTRNYAGIDKAVARRVFVGTQPTVHVTYAGIDDIPLDETSELIVNLHRALLELGDPLVDVRLDRRELLVLILSAGIGLEPDYEWRSVEPKVRVALYDGLGFARRQLAQPVYLSDVQRIIQRVPGVRFVDVDAFGAVAEKEFDKALRSAQAGDELRKLFKDILANSTPMPLIRVRGTEVKDGTPLPAQLAVLSPDVTDSLFLREVTP